MIFDLEKLIRENIKKVKPYSSARDEFSGEANVYLDANENSLGSPLIKWYNRYPDPHQLLLKNAIGNIKSIDPAQIFLGNGSDECIDLLFRCFCEPARDNVLICPPTYGMYEVSAAINDVGVKRVLLTPDFQLDLEAIEEATDSHTRIIWICSPNNPTGNSMRFQDIEWILNNFPGLVVVDEAYINFARQRSMTTVLDEYPNLIVLQTFSKAWGLAGLRLGIAIASKEIASLLDRIKPPYNISQPTQEMALKALEELGQVNDMIREIVGMRDELEKVFRRMPWIERVYPSEANFLLIKMNEATKAYQYLADRGIIVRDRSRVQLCEDCLRITIGTESENTELVDALIAYAQENSIK